VARLDSWTRGDVLLAAGAAAALAASADAARGVRERFAVDLGGLSAAERAAVALWDTRPLATAVFVAATACAWIALRNRSGVLGAAHGVSRPVLAFLAAAHAALAVLVVAAACWVTAAGRIGRADELGFTYTAGERATTLVTQLVAWLPLAALLCVLAALLVRDGEVPAAEVPPTPGPAVVVDEMQALWEERLAHGPRRERARALLARIRALEAAGDHDGARRLADEMRLL
jgi:hypothetical protein